MSDLSKLHRDVTRIYRQSEDMGYSAPQVMHKRLFMLANQKPFDNAKEMGEIERMVGEKTLAFFESWQNMGLQTWIAQQNIGQLMFDNWLKLSFGKPIAYDQIFYQINFETLKILEKGMYPIHRRVLANAKRLA